MSTRSTAGLPAFWVMTDPQRLPDPIGLAQILPAGSGLIYRHFGAADRLETGFRLAEICRHRDCTLLVGADPQLARRIGADGVHWPERLMPQVRRSQACPGLQTASAHSMRALFTAERSRMDAVICSPVFPSRSPSAGRPLGIHRLGTWARISPLPIIALGGIDARTIKRMQAIGLGGIAVVGAAAQT